MDACLQRVQPLLIALGPLLEEFQCKPSQVLLQKSYLRFQVSKPGEEVRLRLGNWVLREERWTGLC